MYSLKVNTNVLKAKEIYQLQGEEKKKKKKKNLAHKVCLNSINYYAQIPTRLSLLYLVGACLV